MTKGLTKRIKELEKQVKILTEKNKNDTIMIGNILGYLRQSDEKFTFFDISRVVLAKILIKSKLTTDKKISKLYDKEFKKIEEQREKAKQEKMNKMKNSKETLKKEIEKKDKTVN